MQVDFSSFYTGRRHTFDALSHIKYLFSQKRFFFLFLLVLFFSPFYNYVGSTYLPQESSVQKTTESIQDESCYWNKDVSQFLSLQSQSEVILQNPIPCEMKVPYDVVFESKKEIKDYDNDLKKQIDALTVGYPISDMTHIIATYDREIAGLIVGIAKKESNWGKRVPVDASGKDCFNYWGYKGAGTRGIEMGHGCFGSKEEAVNIIGERLKQLTERIQTSEPKSMIVWKCGRSCVGHSDESVRKWISDVSIYYDQIVPRSVTYLDK